MNKTHTTGLGNTELKKLRKDELLERLEATLATEDGSKRWAYAGVILMGLLSMWLNGYHASTHGENPLSGWVLGIAIPSIVLLVARVAGLKYKAGKITVAKAGATIVVILLGLSVWHCAGSISVLMHCHIVLALPLAVAIDAGLVYCEYATLDA